MVPEPDDVSKGLGASDIPKWGDNQEILNAISMVFLNLGADPLENIRFVLNAGKVLLGSDLSIYCRYHRGYLQIMSTSPEEDGLRLSYNPQGNICQDVIAGKVESPMILCDFEGTGYENSDLFIVKYGFKACTVLPIFLNEKIIGCMLAYYLERRGFLSEEIAVMTLGAKVISIEEDRAAYEESLKDLVDIVSHELRHPITILKGYSDFLRESWQSMEEDKINDILFAIESSANRLENMVNELLDVSRIEKGLFTLNIQEVNLKPLVKKAAREMGEKGIDNDIVISIPQADMTLKVDPERLTQLIIILLDNAAKYSPPNSSVEIKVDEEDGHPVISVLDRGPGVDVHNQNMIFERFYQSEEARNHSKSGIGLGLFIARKIVEAHGGRIWCEPREGGGSAFRFSLS